MSVARIADLADRAAAYRSVELALFGALGRWAAEGGELAGFLAVRCHAHAWHADLWAQRFPVIPGRVLPAADAHPELLGALEHLEGDVPRLAAVYRAVVPRLAVSYAAYGTRLEARTDGPTVRVVELCRRDVFDDWVAGESLIQGHLTDAAAIRAGAAAQVALESVLVAHAAVP